MGGARAAAHGAGILHRDVKPQNILVSGYGEPALADFGIAMLAGAIDVSAPPDALTPYHVAPEILEGRPPSVASDGYSLGSTLHQLLTGRPAYRRADGAATPPPVLRLLNEEPPDIARPAGPGPRRRRPTWSARSACRAWRARWRCRASSWSRPRARLRRAARAACSACSAPGWPGASWRRRSCSWPRAWARTRRRRRPVARRPRRRPPPRPSCRQR